MTATDNNEHAPMISLYSLRALLWQRAMRVFSISFPITKGLKFIPWAMPNLRLRILTNHFIFTDVSEQKGIFQKKKALSIQIIEERINLQRGFLPRNSTAHRQNILQRVKT